MFVNRFFYIRIPNLNCMSTKSIYLIPHFIAELQIYEILEGWKQQVKCQQSNLISIPYRWQVEF